MIREDAILGRQRAPTDTSPPVFNWGGRICAAHVPQQAVSGVDAETSDQDARRRAHAGMTKVVRAAYS